MFPLCVDAFPTLINFLPRKSRLVIVTQMFFSSKPKHAFIKSPHKLFSCLFYEQMFASSYVCRECKVVECWYPICQSVLSCEMFINIFTEFRVTDMCDSLGDTKWILLEYFVKYFCFSLWMSKVSQMTDWCAGPVTRSLSWATATHILEQSIDHPKVTNRRQEEHMTSWTKYFVF